MTTSSAPTRTFPRSSRGGLYLYIGAACGILGFIVAILMMFAMKATLVSLTNQVAPKQPGTSIVVEFSPFGWIGNLFGWLINPWTLVVVMAIGILIAYARSQRRPRRS